MLRTARETDRPAIADVVVAAGLFTRDEADVVDDVLRRHLTHDGRADYRCLLLEEGGFVTAVALAAAREVAHLVWELTMIGVRPERQGRGDGTALLGAIERSLTEAGVRLLVVETSATAPYDGARSFYAARGYAEQGRIHDYWTDGDDLVVFTKRLRPPQ